MILPSGHPLESLSAPTLSRKKLNADFLCLEGKGRLVSRKSTHLPTGPGRQVPRLPRIYHPEKSALSSRSGMLGPTRLATHQGAAVVPPLGGLSSPGNPAGRTQGREGTDQPESGRERSGSLERNPRPCSFQELDSPRCCRYCTVRSWPFRGEFAFLDWSTSTCRAGHGAQG